MASPHMTPPQTRSSSRPGSDRARGRGAALRDGEAPIDAEAQEEMIRVAAYFQAERRGFEAGHEMDDWLAAEHEIREWLATRAAPRRYSR